MKGICFGLLAAVAAICCGCFAAERPWLVVNEDNDHYFKQDASLMTEAGLVAYVDGIAQGHVTHFFMCVNGQRTSYASKTWEPIWTNLDTDRALQPTGPNHTRDVWAVNAKRLFDAGIDPYAVWTRRCREKGVSPWISMRMNDVHFSEITNFFRNTTFCRTRRDLWRVPDAPDGDETWAKYALDYAHPEVREYNLAQFREIAERWDADGIELDWMRFGEHLKPGREVEDAHFLTEFMRAARRIADGVSAKRGRKLQLAVRVPRSPELAMRTGFRVDDWVKEGLVDLVIGHSFLNADFDLPVDVWRKFLAARDPKVRFLPGIDIVAKPGSRRLKTKPVYMTMAHYRGIADNFYRRGARGLYLFNAPYLPKVFAEICREGLSPAAVAAGEKLYVETQPDFPPDYESELPPLAGDGVRDDTAAIQARLDAGASCVYLPPPEKEYCISKSLELSSGQELRLDRFTKVRLLPGSNCPMVMNRDREKGNAGIAVTGGRWEFDNVKQLGNEFLAKEKRPPSPGYPRGCIFFFDRVERLAVRGVTFANPVTFSCQLMRTSHFTVEDVNFDFTTWNPKPINMDGIHLDGGCHHGRIANLHGTCFDDMVALNANDAHDPCHEGAISDIDIDGLYSTYTHRGVRILSTGAPIRNVTVRNVHIVTYRNLVAITHFFPERKTSGDFDNIVIRDCSVSSAPQPEELGPKYRAWPMVWVETGSKVGQLVLDNVCRDERYSASDATIGIEPGVRIGNLVIRNCRQVNEVRGDLVFLSQRGDVDRLDLGPVSMESAPNAGPCVLRRDVDDALKDN